GSPPREASSASSVSNGPSSCVSLSSERNQRPALRSAYSPSSSSTFQRSSVILRMSGSLPLVIHEPIRNPVQLVLCVVVAVHRLAEPVVGPAQVPLPLPWLDAVALRAVQVLQAHGELGGTDQPEIGGGGARGVAARAGLQRGELGHLLPAQVVGDRADRVGQPLARHDDVAAAVVGHPTTSRPRASASSTRIRRRRISRFGSESG